MSGTTPRSGLRRACSFNGDYFSQTHVPIAAPGNVDRELLDQFSPTASRRRAHQGPRIPSSRDVPRLSVADEETDTDPKRNRLGYTRSTIACGTSAFTQRLQRSKTLTDPQVHCRRRKIRCIVSTKDPTGRCTHCLRMKKDCSYLPVDQSLPSKRKKNKRQQPLLQAGASRSNIVMTSSLDAGFPLPTLFDHGAAAALGRTLAPAPGLAILEEQTLLDSVDRTTQAPSQYLNRSSITRIILVDS